MANGVFMDGDVRTRLAVVVLRCLALELPRTVTFSCGYGNIRGPFRYVFLGWRFLSLVLP